MVAPQFLVLFVWVRILAEQHSKPNYPKDSWAFAFFKIALRKTQKVFFNLFI
jgi:hypothetical protein